MSQLTDQQALQRVIEHREIFHDEMLGLMRRIMTGEMSPVVMAAFIAGLRVKKETVGEITAAAQVMREFATPVHVANTANLVDLCGTGGDGAHTFNISTAAMFVAAAAGARIAKHGGRSVSSSTGSADALEALGAAITLNAEQVGQCLADTGVGFMFAPNFHGAMKHAAPVRKELGVRTLFNILGPLTNPAGAPNQLMGVFHTDLVGIMARVLQRLGSDHVLVVHGRDGLDEITLSGDTLVAELKNGQINEYTVHPSQFGFAEHDGSMLKANNRETSIAIMRAVLDNQPGPARDIVLLNAGAAIYAANVADSLGEGVERARDALSNGRAADRLRQFTQTTRTLVA
ncbi:MAG: anthranilate phosphoribosyltransferase [Aquabacterium sp.]|jgi:anthranilate phosphoribosyltransferase|uniref:anthranilate phosphoribosyltransferase n=1 Tax=Aquabacterium sp. TaxID=1872578 RepID=UPI001B4FF871|nr:anthranilate phosphoribosyltransferase [Aquabacterium sp.]MBP7133035.1 anthranilate phosphoribosyltransferase [Aquabacterium sp.]MBP9063227.1 anthranilate phosphoribosyltransferase [Aquabacterium sp.]MDQ5927222.1 anthranilate phosphoribosyltransferase [Pseudomonadota bacterium]